MPAANVLRHPSRWTIVIVAVACLLLAIWLAWEAFRTRRALETLPPEERAAVFKEDLEAFRTLCYTAEGPRREPTCRERALSLSNFPECDDACRQLIQPFIVSPAR